MVAVDLVLDTIYPKNCLKKVKFFVKKRASNSCWMPRSHICLSGLLGGIDFEKLFPIEARHLVVSREVSSILAPSVMTYSKPAVVFLVALVGKWSEACSKGSARFPQSSYRGPCDQQDQPPCVAERSQCISTDSHSAL